MTLLAFAVAVSTVIILIVVIGSAATLARRMSILIDAVNHLSASHRTLWHHVDDARYETQVIPERILQAHERSLREQARAS